MTTVTFDPATHAILPIIPDVAQLRAMHGALSKATFPHEVYAIWDAGVKAAPDFASITAPERSEGYTPAAPAQQDDDLVSRTVIVEELKSWRDAEDVAMRADQHWQGYRSGLNDAIVAVRTFGLGAAPAQPVPAADFKLPLPEPLHSIGLKWIKYAQDECDTNDIAFAVWSALSEVAQPVPDANVPKNKSDQQHSMVSALNQVLERDALDAARYRFLEHQCRLGAYAGIISREALDLSMKGGQP